MDQIVKNGLNIWNIWEKTLVYFIPRHFPIAGGGQTTKNIHNTGTVSTLPQTLVETNYTNVVKLL